MSTTGVKSHICTIRSACEALSDHASAIIFFFNLNDVMKIRYWGSERSFVFMPTRYIDD